MQDFPDNVMLITQLRDPVSRTISSYEFAIEVAARKIRVSDEEVDAGVKNTTTVNTHNVWPWSHLVPFFRSDIRKRMAELDVEVRRPDGRKSDWEQHVDEKTNRTYFWNRKTKESSWKPPEATPTLDPYDNPLVMPLKEFIETDIARELILEGHAIQMLGISNLSFWPEAKELRKCFFEDQASRERLANLAKERMKKTNHVGLTESLDASVSSLAATMRVKMDQHAWKTTPKGAFTYDTEKEDSKRHLVTLETLEGPSAGKPIQISLLEAKKIFFSLESRLNMLKKEIAQGDSQLRILMDREKQWMEEQNMKVASADAGNGKSKTATWNFLPAFKNALIRWLGGQPIDRESNDKVQSPWSKEKESLNLKMMEKRQTFTEIEKDVNTLKQIKQINVGLVPTGKARMLVPDREFKDPRNLGLVYRECELSASARAKHKKKESFKAMVTPWGESLQFTSAARKNIDQSIIDRIRELNKVDVELYDIGKTTLEHEIEAQKEAGVFEPLPNAMKQSQLPPNAVANPNAISLSNFPSLSGGLPHRIEL